MACKQLRYEPEAVDMMELYKVTPREIRRALTEGSDVRDEDTKFLRLRGTRGEARGPMKVLVEHNRSVLVLYGHEWSVWLSRRVCRIKEVWVTDHARPRKRKRS